MVLAAIISPVGQALAESTNEGEWTTADINVNGSSGGWRSIASSDDGMKLIAANWNVNTIQTSSNGGVTWTAHTLGRWPFNAVASSADGMTLYAAGASIFVSTDGGASWVERSATAGGSSWLSIVSSADGTKLVAGKYGYIYTSTDSGITWTEHASMGNGYWWDVASSPDGTSLIVADNTGSDNNGGSVYTSTDSGVTWTERSTLGKRIWDGIAISADGSKMAISVNYDSANDTGGYIYTSIDGGATWIERTSAGVRYWNGIASSADGSKLVVTDGDSGSVYTSTDSGVTWTERPLSHPCFLGSVVSSADGSKIMVACNYYGPLYSSVDSGVTWTAVDSVQTSKNQWRSLSSSADGTKLIAGGLGNNGAGDYVHTSNDGGNTWAKQQNLGVGYWSTVTYSADGTHLAAADPYGPNGAGTGGYLYTSSNGGASWVKQTSLGVRYWMNVKMSFDGMKIVAVSDTAVLVSNDSGVTWTERAPTTGLHSWWSSVAMSMDGSKLFVTDGHGSDIDYDGGYLYTSSDSGASWVAVSALGKGHWLDMAVSADGKTIVVTDFYHYLYTSTDGGATWVERKPGDVQMGWSRVAMSADGQKLIVTPNNFNFPPYASADGGDTWFPLNILGLTDNYDGWGPVASSYDGRKVAVGEFTGKIHMGMFPYQAVDPVFPTIPPVVNTPPPSPTPATPTPVPVASLNPHEPSAQRSLIPRTDTGNGDAIVKTSDDISASPADQLEAGVAFYSGKGQALRLEKGEVVKFRAADGGPHTATIDRIEGDKVTFTLRSTPQTISLKIGQTGKYDVNNDGRSDISVTLNSIVDGVANLSFAAIPSAQQTAAKSTPAVTATPSKLGLMPISLIATGALVGVGLLVLIVRRLRRG